MPLNLFIPFVAAAAEDWDEFQMEVSDVQKLGAGLATFGIFFLLLGVLLLFDKAPALIYLWNIIFYFRLNKQKESSINIDEFWVVITSVGLAGSRSESRRAQIIRKTIKGYEISFLEK
jgi:hypothetical protein